MTEYRTIFEREILQKSKSIIFSYSPIDDKYRYQSFSHSTEENSVENLGELMRHNLLFYSFGEDEIVKYYEEGLFSTLDQAAKYAYQQRLPKREATMDGLPGEVLFDLLVQLCDSEAHKLAVRTIFRQNDNNEIKGYDLMYFTKKNSEIILWLGQAKMGDKNYCKRGINDDLTNKNEGGYLANQLFFVCDKRVHIVEDVADLLALIERLNIQMQNDNDEDRVKGLIEFFRKENVKIKIPCLLAYDSSNVYNDATKIKERVEKEVSSIRDYYQNKEYNFEDFISEIVFYIFPIESLDRLRDKKRGFYAGLY